LRSRSSTSPTWRIWSGWAFGTGRSTSSSKMARMIWDHQITTLRTLVPFVRDGGFYVVEDLETNCGSHVDRYRGLATFSCVEYLKRLVDYRVADSYLDIKAEEDAFLRTYGRSVFTVTFCKHLCLLDSLPAVPCERTRWQQPHPECRSLNSFSSCASSLSPFRRQPNRVKKLVRDFCILSLVFQDQTQA
jgi:hypothetical protein